ncbi:hypothetical protein BLNAU_18499 [Blattamonas nauphoetae]|uniref:Uncharacterized protein n=1 Tax=Blattamonas nauphoetae TaxID=2049346 RepID=A0ABQ9X8M2_9EUKA|nr:hypothetical protein BLNAU_18499 [Blattamonas nauphoetae]
MTTSQESFIPPIETALFLADPRQSADPTFIKNLLAPPPNTDRPRVRRLPGKAGKVVTFVQKPRKVKQSPKEETFRLRSSPHFRSVAIKKAEYLPNAQEPSRISQNINASLKLTKSLIQTPTPSNIPTFALPAFDSTDISRPFETDIAYSTDRGRSSIRDDQRRPREFTSLPPLKDGKKDENDTPKRKPKKAFHRESKKEREDKELEQLRAMVTDRIKKRQRAQRRKQMSDTEEADTEGDEQDEELLGGLMKTNHPMVVKNDWIDEADPTEVFAGIVEMSYDAQAQESEMAKSVTKHRSLSVPRTFGRSVDSSSPLFLTPREQAQRRRGERHGIKHQVPALRESFNSPDYINAVRERKAAMDYEQKMEKMHTQLWKEQQKSKHMNQLRSRQSPAVIPALKTNSNGDDVQSDELVDYLNQQSLSTYRGQFVTTTRSKNFCARFLTLVHFSSVFVALKTSLDVDRSRRSIKTQAANKRSNMEKNRRIARKKGNTEMIIDRARTITNFLSGFVLDLQVRRRKEFSTLLKATLDITFFRKTVSTLGRKLLSNYPKIQNWMRALVAVQNARRAALDDVILLNEQHLLSTYLLNPASLPAATQTILKSYLDLISTSPSNFSNDKNVYSEVPRVQGMALRAEKNPLLPQIKEDYEAVKRKMRNEIKKRMKGRWVETDEIQTPPRVDLSFCHIPPSIRRTMIEAKLTAVRLEWLKSPTQQNYTLQLKLKDHHTFPSSDLYPYSHYWDDDDQEEKLPFFPFFLIVSRDSEEWVLSGIEEAVRVMHDAQYAPRKSRHTLRGVGGSEVRATRQEMEKVEELPVNSS